VESNTSEFPLFNRIVVFAISLITIIAIPLEFWHEYKSQEKIDLVNNILLLIFFLISCFGMWFSLKWKSSTNLNREEASDLEKAIKARCSNETFTYRFMIGLKQSAVHLDPTNQKIIFFNCHVPRRFLSMTSECFECSLDMIHAVHLFRYRGESLTVVTNVGRAVIPMNEPASCNIKNKLLEIAPSNKAGFSADHPMMGLVYVLGALTGLFTGVYATPPQADPSTLSLFLIIGSVIGVAIAYLIVWIGDRWIQVNLAKQIGYLTLGGGAGLTLSELTAVLHGINMMITITLMLIGALLGLAYSILFTKR